MIFKQGSKVVTHVDIGKISKQREFCAKALRQDLAWSVQGHVAGEEQGEEGGIGQVCVCMCECAWLYRALVNGGQSRLGA